MLAMEVVGWARYHFLYLMAPLHCVGEDSLI